MIADKFPLNQTTEDRVLLPSSSSYVDWSAILAGGVVALAISSLLIFGGSLGLSLDSPYRGEGVSSAWLAIAGGIWVAWVRPLRPLKRLVLPV